MSRSPWQTCSVRDSFFESICVSQFCKGIRLFLIICNFLSRFLWHFVRLFVNLPLILNKKQFKRNAYAKNFTLIYGIDDAPYG